MLWNVSIHLDFQNGHAIIDASPVRISDWALKKQNKLLHRQRETHGAAESIALSLNLEFVESRISQNVMLTD